MSTNSKILIKATYQELINFISENIGEITFNGVKQRYDNCLSGDLQLTYKSKTISIYFVSEKNIVDHWNVPNGSYVCLIATKEAECSEALRAIAAQFNGYAIGLELN